MDRLLVGGCLLVFTLLGFVLFPGHTFLQSDTQIYLPMLEHLLDPSVLARDPIATRPHLSFTIYDEVAVFLRRLTGAEFQTILVAQQLIFRFLGLLGVYLIGLSLKLSTRMALLVTCIFSLGATILGPAVLTVEYEPVPRGFAVPLVMLAIGLAARGRDLLAGVAASVAFLYHAPTTAPFWIIYFVLTLWPSRPEMMKRRLLGLAPLLAAVLLLFLLSRMQPGVLETQQFLGKITPEHEQVQRMRASYNWVSIWAGNWMLHYVFLFVMACGAFWRVRADAPFDLKCFLIGLPVLGLFSIPASYILLEQLRWSLIPQFQPGRALLFLTATTVIAGAAAAVKSAQERRIAEATLWLLIVVAVPIRARISEVLIPDFSSAAIRWQVLTLWLLVAVFVTAIIAEVRMRRWALAPWALALLLPFWLIPSLAGTTNYPPLHSADLEQLSSWARTSVAKDAMFLFPDAGREQHPGVFRARALRAVYVDWKGGGQINYHRLFADEWWNRWQTMILPKFDRANLQRYTDAGVDYIVVKPVNRLADRTPVFENSRFVAYDLRAASTARQ